MNQCKICNNTNIYGGRKYCSEPCRKIAQKASNRVTSQLRRLKLIKKGKECKRCKDIVYEAGMKTYCKKCKVIMQVARYTTYTPKKEESITKTSTKKIYTCKTCDNERIRTKTYCDTCKENLRVSAMEKQKPQRAGRGRGVNNKKASTKHSGTINPKYLVRGPISVNILTSLTGG